MTFEKVHDSGVRSKARSWEENLETVSQLQDLFEEAGCATACASRIGAYRRAFLDLYSAGTKQKSYSPRMGEELMQSLVSYEELSVILKAVRASSDPEEWYPAIRAMASGDPFPLHSGDSDSSSGRDIQFECFVAAICQLGGYAAKLSEPDIRIEGFGHHFVIAAKRPRSRGSVLKNFRKARNQIGKSGERGIIALEISNVILRGQLVRSLTDEDAATFARATADKFFLERKDQFHNLVQESSTFGAFVSLHLPVQTYTATAHKKVATAIRWAVGHFIPPATDRDLEDLETFTKRCEVGLFGQSS